MAVPRAFTHIAICTALWMVLCASGGPLSAQEPGIVPFEFAKDPDYKRQTRFTRLQTDVVYIDRLTGQIPMDGVTLRPADVPEDEQTGGVSQTGSRWLLFLALSGLLLILFAKRRELRAIFRRAPAPATRAPHAVNTAEVSPAHLPGLLGEIAAMPDRQAALLRLIGVALPAAARANGLRHASSETARDLLSRLPSEWPHRDKLRQIVMTEELVQFGGRRLSEPAFQACLQSAQSILAPIPQGRAR